ncbi:uncharacterized protein LOC101850528 [Aplysia californica]|uniref:SPRY domain-containing SOCS box protein 3 n=1 Tax=Aplysia californica TaxID=6500 RepID=A0ABM1ADW3_APLCA|nr:uncharacterized protein LOC101850528 [Aplysia californica]XP_012945823.1 uncharacterized protein LOC101850528 [Aplysia californica]
MDGGSGFSILFHNMDQGLSLTPDPVDLQERASSVVHISESISASGDKMSGSERLVSQGTSMDTEEVSRSSCKYCSFRLSKLRLLEKIKSRTAAERSGESSPKSHSPRTDRGCQTSASLFEKAEMTQKELRSLALVLRFPDGKPLKTETFCKCVLQGRERDCRCGEDEKYFDWTWDPEHRGEATSLQEKGRQVIFHKDYSLGTAAIRGQLPMDKDQYFWEVKMTTPVYGTDMMVGVGTANVDLRKYHNVFYSMLGTDMDSWGISYDGRVQHGGKKREYCSRFGQGAIIGVHLDMWHGTLAFFKNRQSLGIAFRGLRGRTLFPMACSTAARSGMRVISSRSFPMSLQFLCCRRLRQFVPAHLSVLDSLAMPPGLRAFLANNMTWLLDVPQSSAGHAASAGYICPICLPLKSVFEGCTDDEDSDEDIRASHLTLHLGDSDDDSDGAESVSSDIQDLMAEVAAASRGRTVSENESHTSPPRSPSADTSSTFQRQSRFGVKKRRVDFEQTGSRFTFAEQQHEGELSKSDEDSTSEDSSSAELQNSGSSQTSSSGPSWLGKRKHE